MTLTASLQDRSDADLLALLRTRPDVLVPAPPTSWPVLLSRLTSWPSIARCLEGLDRFSHQLLAGLCLLGGPATADEVATALGSDRASVSRDEIAAGLDRLVDLGLCWVAGADQGGGIMVYEQLRRALPRPAGLGAPWQTSLHPTSGRGRCHGPQPRARGRQGRPHKKAVVIDQLGSALRQPGRVEEILASAPDEAQAVMAELADSGATRIRSHLHWYGQQPRGPLEWLASRGLLASAGWGLAEVPREVGRQRFLAEQGYAYEIIDTEAVLAGS